MNVTRITHHHNNMTATKENWSIYFKAPHFFKLHYFKGQDERIIIGNRSYIWEYVPQHKALLETDIRHLSEEEKITKASLATAIVRLPFVWIYKEINMLKDMNIIEDYFDTGKALLITGKLQFEGETYSCKIWLDKDKLNILKMLLLNEHNQVVLQVDYLLPQKVTDKVWFPKKVIYSWKNYSVPLTIEVTFDKIKINEHYSDDFFTFTKTKNMKIWTKKAKRITGIERR